MPGADFNAPIESFLDPGAFAPLRRNPVLRLRNLLFVGLAALGVATAAEAQPGPFDAAGTARPTPLARL